VSSAAAPDNPPEYMPRDASLLAETILGAKN